MDDLTEQTCTACRVGAPLVATDEIQVLMQEIPQWKLVNIDGIKRLQRVFEFKNYQSTLVFANQVAGIADEQGHHPAILIEWGRVTVSWWSHKIKGLHVNDFIMAARSDALL